VVATKLEVSASKRAPPTLTWNAVCSNKALQKSPKTSFTYSEAEPRLAQGEIHFRLVNINLVLFKRSSTSNLAQLRPTVGDDPGGGEKGRSEVKACGQITAVSIHQDEMVFEVQDVRNTVRNTGLCCRAGSLECGRLCPHRRISGTVSETRNAKALQKLYVNT
jgi:hypothetical protein